MNLTIDLKNSGIPEAKIAERRDEAHQVLKKIWSQDLDFTGWVKCPSDLDPEELQKVKDAADRIRKTSDYFLVLGVGGSFMGAKAVIDLLKPEGCRTEVLFAGYHFSARYIQELLQKIEGKDLSICVISKSGTTTETLSAYGIFKEYMLEKYGEEETAARTYVITEHRSNYLFDAATAEGCTIFDLPLNVGGRYSVLTPVGLLPIAAAGIDIDGLLKGAAELAHEEMFDGDGLDYAILRQAMYDSGKTIEVFEFFDTYAAYFGEWLKQLFGESEGKDGKGLFPASLIFSRDLHSMGQFLQQGTPSFFETFLLNEHPAEDVEIPETAMKPFAGKTIQQINTCAEKGVYDAHVKAGIPAIRIMIDYLNPERVGELIFYFEVQCAVSAMLSGVDPFNQPGVEAYKKEMRSYIEKLD